MSARDVHILAHHVACLEARIAKQERLLRGLLQREAAPTATEVRAELGPPTRHVRLSVGDVDLSLRIVRGPYADDDGELVLDLLGQTGILHGIPVGSVQEVA
ncbi:MAG: hypothetical protein K1X67_07920 [Fimbriimonadaceae bacterium]|nr:hypothetical protein [Fimbriimonadaceae bacterium]